MFSLHGKRALVIGIANAHSIAYGIASALHRAGADLAITYLNAKAEPHVRPLGEALGASLIEPLDVNHDEQTLALFERLAASGQGLDILVHSIAFAPAADLHGRVVDCSRAGFLQAMDTSVHSFFRLAHLAEPLMRNGGAMMTMSFFGAERVVGTYNLMGPVKAALEAGVRELASELGASGITVNAISPGTMATRAASGLDHFDEMMREAESRSPLKRLAGIEDVGALASFLASEGGKNITGTVIQVDAGFHIMA
ncbi:MAG: enoyl-ACP reductase FabI [Proteobacteria bacterium]|nr:enoyl-ACP reductase FabI [Pseudomonadota bacterium]